MSRHTAILFGAFFLFASQIFAAECKNPFATMVSRFQLVERLKCDGITTPTVLEIKPIDGPVPENKPFLKPGCDEKAPYFNLYSGTILQNGQKYDEINAYSDPLSDALQKTVRISRSCDGIRLFLIERDPKLLTLPSGKSVNTSLRVYAENAERSLLGYALANEDTVNGLVLRDEKEAIVASASKTLRNINNGDFCAEAIWTVSNNANSELMATVTSYLLSLRDNADFNCIPLVPAVVDSLSTGAKIGIGITIGASVVTAAAVSTFCYLKNRPGYRKLTE